MRELEERQLLSVRKSGEQEDNDGEPSLIKPILNPLDLLDQEKLLSDLERKKTLFQGRIHDKNEHIKGVELTHDRLKKSIYDLSEQNIHRMMTELETGGNIRFEEGRPTDKWFTSCDDLIRSRFDTDYMKKRHGITDITILRVTRIHNRFLRNRFEEKVEQLVDVANSVHKKSIEYLFYGVDPKAPNEVFRAMEEGFRGPNEYIRMGLPQHVALVNSIISAESPRIMAHLRSGDGKF